MNPTVSTCKTLLAVLLLLEMDCEDLGRLGARLQVFPILVPMDLATMT